MVFGKKNLTIKIKNGEKPKIKNGISNIVETVDLNSNGNSFFYRSKNKSFITNKRIKSDLSKEDLEKIKINRTLFCTEKNITINDLFNKGEKGIISSEVNTIYLKTFPIKEIVVLMKYDNNITEITGLCIIDYISGKIKAPNNIEGIYSILYTVKKINTCNHKFLNPVSYNFGVQKIGV